MSTFPRTVPLVLASAVLGAGAAVGAVAAFDLGGGSTTTVVEQAPLGSPAESRQRRRPDRARHLQARRAGRRLRPRRGRPAQLVALRLRDALGAARVATGSGFVIDREGTILTNQHVVEGARKVTVQFADKRTATAQVVGRTASTDLAAAAVDTPGSTSTRWRSATARRVQVGDPTIAIGNPFGLERTLTTGVVSAAPAPDQGPERLHDRQRASRPTPRSTPATRAARCSTPPGASSASTRRSRPAARAAATSASASPSRSTPPSASSPSSRRAGRSTAASSASARRRSTAR